MSFLEGLLTLTLIHFIATVSPGPEFMLISKEALSRGRKAGFISLAGTLCGLSIHILYSAFGLAAVISQSPYALLVIQVFGGCYLIYLGVNGIRSKPLQPESSPQISSTANNFHLFRTGFFCDLFNPKAPVYFISLFTFVLSPELPANQIVLYGALIMSIHLVWFSLVVLLLSSETVSNRFRGISHWVDRVLGGAMIAIGMKVIIN